MSRLALSCACFTNASCREKERILQRWADLACDVMLSGQPWSSLGVLVEFLDGDLPLVFLRQGHFLLTIRLLTPSDVL